MHTKHIAFLLAGLGLAGSVFAEDIHFRLDSPPSNVTISPASDTGQVPVQFVRESPPTRLQKLTSTDPVATGSKSNELDASAPAFTPAPTPTPPVAKTIATPTLSDVPLSWVLPAGYTVEKEDTPKLKEIPTISLNKAAFSLRSKKDKSYWVSVVNKWSADQIFDVKIDTSAKRVILTLKNANYFSAAAVVTTPKMKPGDKLVFETQQVVSKQGSNLWQIKQDEKLTTVLQRWTKQADWQFYWDTEAFGAENFLLGGSLTLQGDFLTALTEFAESLDNSIRVVFCPNTKNKMLVVTVQGKKCPNQ